MGTLRINGDSSGYVQLSAPANSGNTSLTLPLNGFGKVLQVVYNNYSTALSGTSTATWQDTGLTATITPSSITSKILVMVHQSGVGKTSGDEYVGMRLMRDSTNVQTFETILGYTATAGTNISSTGTFHLDVPETTSSITYKTQYRGRANGGNIVINYNNATSSIILVEVAA